MRPTDRALCIRRIDAYSEATLADERSLCHDNISDGLTEPGERTQPLSRRLAEMRRVVRTGGVVVAAGWDSFNRLPQSRIISPYGVRLWFSIPMPPARDHCSACSMDRTNSRPCGGSWACASRANEPADQAARQYVAAGVHVKQYFDHAPTGGAIRVEEISIYEIRNGLVAEQCWLEEIEA
jgi:hypothetical protein